MGDQLIVSGLESAMSLIQTARNLLNAVVLTVRSAYIASTMVIRLIMLYNNNDCNNCIDFSTHLRMGVYNSWWCGRCEHQIRSHCTVQTWPMHRTSHHQQGAGPPLASYVVHHTGGRWLLSRRWLSSMLPNHAYIHTYTFMHP